MRRILALILVCASGAAQTPMERLSSVFSGHWTISVKEKPGPGQSNAVTTSGEEDWHTLAGGIPLVEEYRSKSSNRGEDYDTATFWWDAATQKYRGTFCADFVDEGCAPFDIEWKPTGHKQGTIDLITMSGAYLQNGKKFVWRETFDFKSRDKFIQSLYEASQGLDLKLVSTITATRTAARK